MTFLSKVLIAILFLAYVCAQNPTGFKVCVSYDGIVKIKDTLLPIIQPQIVGMSIPDVSGSSSTPIGIDIKYHLSDISIASFSFGTSNLFLTANQGVTVQLTGTSCTLTMNWSYSTDVLISGSGSATDNLNMDITALIAITDNQGKPYMSVTGITVDITSIDITVHGGSSWFYQTMVDLFKSKIKGIVQNAIQSELNNVLNNMANQFLSDMSVEFTISNTMQLDYSLTMNPHTDWQYSVTDHYGMFTWIQTGDTCTYTYDGMPDRLSGQPLTFVIDTQMGNCIAKLLYDAQMLSYTITPSMVPSNCPVQLYTNDSNIERLIPNLQKNYPNRPINIKTSLLSAPHGFINNSLYDIVLHGQLEVDVVMSDGSTIPAFTANVDGLVSMNVGITNQRMTASINSVTHNTSIATSKIGDVNAENVDDIVNFFVAFGVEPKFNAWGKQGIPFPTVDGVSLTNTALTYQSYYFMVGSDFTYSSTAMERHLTQMRKLQQRPVVIN